MYYIVRGVHSVVRRSVDRSVGIFIGIRLVIVVVVAVESGEDGEVGEEVTF